MTLTRLVVSLGLLTLGCIPARASEPTQSPAPTAAPLHAAPPEPPASAAALPPRLESGLVDTSLHVPPAAGPVPWTHSRAQNDAETFQFAIVTDRTGGMRDGVFDSAVRKLNLLEPEFVISVGDLIAGYTENSQKLQSQWDEFDALVRGLSAPFFYVPGNHDLSNDAMREVWRQRYGNTYYSFVYKNVLFVCLNSMDGGLHQISETQVAWLRAELAKHEQVRWTLVFLHTPLWDDPAGSAVEASPWAPLEAALGQRRYTVFAGHHHRYVKRELNSRKYFTLATTGGGSALRGPAYGEFDHVVWVTMTRDGPKLANLMLDGIQDEGVRTDALRNFQNSVLADDTLKPSPVYYEGAFRSGKSQLVVRNDRDVPLTVTLEPRADSGLSSKPARLEVVLPPNSRGDYEFELKSLLIAPRPLMKLPLAWSARAVAAQGEQFELSGTTALSLVRLLSIPRAAGRVVADGSLREWERHRMTAGAPTQVVRNPENHQGAGDARFAVGLSHSKTMLSVAVEVHDDHVHAEKG
ncbi:MAG TPA: metallophosphoesterase, partial [Polyangiaceae bacterium]|nr:metallophosphoesterase [Polyangiaceae bacterium]